ncbi:chromatin modification-like protein vid21 [Phlyctema vagabunda]|uniref:Vacuolar import and degradation protein 21 n=1 Tax=Phlyctema vagabunda TaxID=108571 RepID=A0ABR4P4D9_9HELO
MSEVVAADRSRLLRSKRAESSRIVTSRKRKLREFFAVCDSEEPLPTIISLRPSPRNNNNDDDDDDGDDNDNDNNANDAEREFLQNCDIVQDRLFDEAHLPARRQLRSNTAKQQSLAPPGSPESKNSDASRGSSKKDGQRKSRTTSPIVVEDGKPARPSGVGKQEKKVNGEGTPMQRSSSKGSQTDRAPDPAVTLDEIVDETLDQAHEDQPRQSSPPNLPAPPGALETERIKTGVESKPGSPGVDPRKAIPVSAEEAAQLSEPLIYGQANHDERHKAATVHLPPREVQEARLRNNKGEHSIRTRNPQQQLSINLPGRETGQHSENLSSPGSTSHSATTPALHGASTDTSPDNEGSRYDADRVEDKDEVPETPPELRPTPQEAAKKAEHDRILKAQIEVASAEILRSSPAAIDAQIRLEEQAAAESSQAAVDAAMEGKDGPGQISSDGLTQEASAVVKDIVDDQPENSAPAVGSNPTPSGSQDSAKASEIPDSEAASTPRDAMDIDTTTIKDSFDTNPGSEAVAASSPVPEIVQSQPPEKPARQSVEATPPTPAASTPQLMSPAAPTPNTERMTTRVASGAIRHKSVSEILGEIPRPNTAADPDRSAAGKSAAESSCNSPSRSSTPQSPGTRVKSLIERAKEKERSKLSTVVFAKQPAKRSSGEVALVPSNKKKAYNEHDDYFMPLWRARPDAKNLQSVDSLLQAAHKTVTTTNSFIPILDNQTYRILKRIKELQEMGKWSLRQPKRSPEPNRQTSHWDLVLQEAKWMRTDFREERKWKMTVARNLASACVEWIEANEEDRKLLQVKAVLPPKHAPKDVEMTDAFSQAQSTPDLIASAEVDSPYEDLDDVPRFNLNDTVSPAAIFGLQDDDVIFGLRHSPATDKLLSELPMYGVPLTVPQVSFAQLDIDPDAAWRRPVLALSKYVEGRMELNNDGPPRKRSRFDYEDEEEDEDDVIFGELYAKTPHLPPQSTDVALFNPDNKHIRDRIHPGHHFRPPSEYQMPLQSFFECRTSSQWTWAEDDELKTLVRSYMYNWSLISSMLASKSMYSSGAERRTPWECFERWIHLEGLPADMQKTHYFRVYNTRLEMAQRALAEQVQAAPPQPNAAGQIVPPPRRRTNTTSVRVERRRNQKHLTLVDAMRKLAKKRETNVQKQQHAAGLAAMRKANEVAQPRGTTHTPQDFSRLKFEREQQLQERVARYAQQQEIQRRAAAQLVRNGQNLQQAGPAGAQGLQINRGVPANGMNGQQPQNPNQLAVPGQNRPRAPMGSNPMAPVSMQNGLQVPQMQHMNGVSQAQMQSRLPPPNPAPMLDINTMAQSRRIADQQRQAVQMQQQGQPTQVRNSPPNMRNPQNNQNGATQPYLPNPNMMPPFNPNGVSTPPTHNLNTPGSAGSPRLGQPSSQQLSNAANAHIASLEAQIRAKFPSATPEQLNHMIREQLNKMKATASATPLNQAQLQQAAMNAAAGGNMNSANRNGVHTGVPSGVENSPQLYAQMLRAQQQQQQQQLTQQAHAQQTQSQTQSHPQTHSQPHTQPQPQPQSQPQPTTPAQAVPQTQQQTNPAAAPTPRAGSASSPGGK